ncbi:MAG: hypothetical protein DRI81_19570 [Chloroflexi bacterium]|nr:MAG: hypothetical protein DRI81_19570 [Chloroflexota bacterium]
MAAIGNATRAVQMGIVVVTQSVEKFIEVGREAAQGVDISRIFTQLSGVEGLDADKLLGDLKRVSRGTVSEIELMKAANRALLAGGAEIAEELPRLFEMARGAALATGQDVGHIFETLVKGIVKGSPMLIDNAEIYLSASDAVEEYASSLGKTTDELSRQERMQATLNAVLAESDGYLERLGVEGEMAGDAFSQFDAAAADLKQTLGEALLPTATAVAQALRDLAKASSGGFADEFSTIVEATLAGTETQEDYLGVIQATIEQMNSAQGAMLGLKNSYVDLEPIIRATASSYDEYAAAMNWVWAGMRDTSGMGTLEAAWQREQADNLEILTRAEWDVSQAQEAEAQSAQEAVQAEDELAAAQEATATAAQALADVESKVAAERAAVQAQARERAADEAIRQARRAEDEVIAAERRAEDEAIRLIRQREDAESQAAEQMAAAQAQYEKSVQAARQQHAKRLVSIERNYQRQITQIQQKFEQSRAEAIGNRDALALVRAGYSRDRELADARQQRDEQLQQAGAQYADQLQQAKEARERQEQTARESLQRQEEDLKRSLERQAQDQHIKDQRRGEDEVRAQQRREADLQLHLDRRLAQIRAAHAVELAEAQQHYRNLRRAQWGLQSPGWGIWANKYPKKRAAGGYVERGVYEMGEAGREFVLNAPTTRAVERAVGGELSQQGVLAVLGGGSRSSSATNRLSSVINQNFRFYGSMSASERQWFRQTAREEAMAALGEVMR